VCHLADVTYVLNALSLKLQVSTVTIFEVRGNVISTCAILEALSQTDLEEHPATTPNLCAFINEHLHQGVQDEDRSRIVSELAPYVKDWNEYAANVVSELQSRFPEETSMAVKAFECLFPHMMPPSGTAQFGLDHFDFLRNNFKLLLPMSEGPVEEYQIFKAFLINHWRSLGPAEYMRVALSNPNLRKSCPLAHRLLVIAATLPMTSVECERYFSMMKRIKTELRNRLSVAATSALLITATDAAPVDAFCPLESVAGWHEKRKRQRVAEIATCDAVERESASIIIE